MTVSAANRNEGQIYRVTLDGEDVSQVCRSASDTEGWAELYDIQTEKPDTPEWSAGETEGEKRRNWSPFHNGGYLLCVNGEAPTTRRRGDVSITPLFTSARQG